MRICFISWEYPKYTGFGVIAYYVQEISHRLSGCGFDVTVITANPNNRGVELVKLGNIEIIPMLL
jgi:hypothetical protein